MSIQRHSVRVPGDDDDDDNDDLWALFAEGLQQTNYSYSQDTVSTESEKPFGYYVLIEGILTVLLTCMEELTLLKRIMNTAVDNSWDTVVIYEDLEKRYGGERQLVFEESEFSRLNDRQKCLKDICFVYNIVSAGCEQILEENKYGSIISALEDMDRLEEDANNLLNEESTNSAKLQRLKLCLAKEKRDFLKSIHDRKQELFSLKDEYEDMLIYGKYNVKYIDDWETSRINQKHLLIQQKEESYQKIIQDTTNKLELENRIHNEIVTYLEANKEDMSQEIAYWQHHYEEERDKLDLDIYNSKVQRDQLIEKLEESKVEFEKRKEEIEIWTEYRDKKRAEEKLLEKQTKAVIKIQAWWRGIMVRKHLGPYRKKKKKRKGKAIGKNKKGTPKLPGRSGGPKLPGQKKKKK